MLSGLIKAMLILILILNFLGFLFTSILNSETYFLGNKLNGVKATSYLLANGGIGLLIAYILFKAEEKGAYLSTLFFSYNLISLITYSISPLFLTGLTLSASLTVVLWRKNKY